MGIDMDRRHFLTALIGGSVLDPDRLLWKPGKLISIPARSRLTLATAKGLIFQLEFAGVTWPLLVPPPFDPDLGSFIYPPS